MIEFKSVNKWYGEHHVLSDIDLRAETGEVLVICGPSGSGKSTLIRCANGLEEVQKGSIYVNDICVTDPSVKRHHISAEVGMVFQQFNLYPHMTVLKNIMLAPMKVRKEGAGQAERFARELLEKVHIPEHADKYPSQLSGGQQQRVAIAR